MSSSKLLAQLNDELINLLEMSVPRTCTIFPMNMNIRTGGHGSGWFYSSELVVTNHHVVEGASGEVIVRRAGNGAELRAKVLGSDSFADLAVLRVSKVDTEPFSIRDEPARVGEICIAIGTPMSVELQNSASFGIVSGVGRQVVMQNGRHEEIIQTDAIINGGNSGGPLIDISGQVIGVNFASTNSRSGVTGISMAIPTELVRDVVPEIIEYGGIERASIGVSITARRQIKDHGFETAIQITKTVSEDSPLALGDIISAVNGTPIRRRYDLIRFLNRSMIGTTVELEVLRAGNSVKIMVPAVSRKISTK